MISPSSIKGRFVVFALIALAVVSFLLLGSHETVPGHLSPTRQTGSQHTQSKGAVLTGHAIAPKLGNATVKYASQTSSGALDIYEKLANIENSLRAELGRAAWKVLHTTFARFPEKPTEEEQEALRSYVHLFQRLYPCGECAEHFGQVLAKYPPQVSSRTAAAMWGCFVHNIVNKRLKKTEFDCKNIGDAYDCGCGDEEATDSSKSKGNSAAA